MVLVIDECQKIDGFAPAFWSQLQKVWDLGKSEARLLLVMSSQAWSVSSAAEVNRCTAVAMC